MDNDPIVLAHARALLTSSAQGQTAYLDADLNRPADILTSPVLSGTLDLSRPVALSLLAVLDFLPDAAHPGALIERLMAELPTGSYLVISHATDDRSTPDATQRLVDLYGKQQISIQMRSRDEVAAQVPAGMELIEPGITFLHRWHPDSDADQYADDDAPLYAGRHRHALRTPRKRLQSDAVCAHTPRQNADQRQSTGAGVAVTSSKARHMAA